MPNADRSLLTLIAGVFGLLIVASGTGWAMSRRFATGAAGETVANINLRVRSWWVMVLLFVIGVVSGTTWSILLFGAISFLALREFVTIAPTRASIRA